MAGQEIDGRAIKVDLSLPRPPKDAGAFGDKPKKVFNDTLSGPPTTTLFVGNLPFSATEDAVWAAFADFGDVSSVSLNCHFSFIYFFDTNTFLPLFLSFSLPLSLSLSY